MKALFYMGEKQLELKDAPAPTGEFVLRVTGCTLCGTDLKTWLKGHPMFTPPCILGHEFIGTVERAPQDSGFAKGDPVVVAPYGECGECELCARGAGELCRNKYNVSSGSFCEYVEIPLEFVKKGVIRLDTLDEAYTLVEPLSCVLTAIDKMNITAASNVLVAGGGPMGTLFALVLIGQNISVTVSEPSEERRALLSSLGISAIAPEEADPSLYDNIAVAVSLPKLVEAYVKGIADNGTVHVFAGLPKDAQLNLDPYAIHYRGVTVTGSSGFNLSTFHKAYEMIKSQPDHFRKLITHTFSIEDAQAAFETQASGRAFKVLIRP